MGNFVTRSRHGTTYYFRRRIPASVRLHAGVGQTHFVISLRTGERSVAIKRARAVAVQTDTIFQKIMSAKKPSNGDGFFELDWTVTLDFSDTDNRLTSLTIKDKDTKPELRDFIQATGNALLATAMGQPSQATQKQLRETKSFEKAIEEYLSRTDIKSATKRTYVSRCAHAQSFFGGKDADILSVDQAGLVRYCDHVKKTLPNVTTQGHFINVVCSLLNWHRCRVSDLSHLSVKSLLPKKTTPESDERDAFTMLELEHLFRNAARYRSSCPPKFWLSVVPVMLGCRIEEVCQVHLESDLHYDKESDIWYFVFDEKPDPDGVVRKSLKKLTSWRRAPIPAALVKLGFIDYLRSQSGNGHVRPFQSEWEPREADDPKLGKVIKWSVYPAKWAGRELKAVASKNSFDTTHKLAACHSMRHTHRAAMSRAIVAQEIAEALQGRRYAGSDGARYEKLVKDHKKLSVEGTEKGIGEVTDLLFAVLVPNC